MREKGKRKANMGIRFRLSSSSLFILQIPSRESLSFLPHIFRGCNLSGGGGGKKKSHPTTYPKYEAESILQRSRQEPLGGRRIGLSKHGKIFCRSLKSSFPPSLILLR